MIYYFIYHDIMSEKMIHKREFRIVCNQMSIELLKSLDAFLNKNILALKKMCYNIYSTIKEDL